MSSAPGLRTRLEALLRRSWRGEAGFGPRAAAAVARPVSWLYRGVVALRNAAYDGGLLRIREAEVPVLSVGNLAVGGTGKTPVAAWLARVLADARARPALVARGYGTDELRLHARWNPDVPLHADPDRVAACRAAVTGGAHSVVLDDGFQHRRLARALDIVLLSAEHPFPAPLLPRGPFREPVGSLARADAVVVTRRTASDARADEVAQRVAQEWPHLLVARMDLVPDGWVDLDGQAVEAPPGDALAVTSVAGPEAFAALVGTVSGADPELLAFRDHHDYDAGDADRILRAAGPRPVVTTEKDAVKLEALRAMLPPVRVLRLAIRPGKGTKALLARARNVAGAPADGPGRGRQRSGTSGSESPTDGGRRGPLEERT